MFITLKCEGAVNRDESKVGTMSNKCTNKTVLTSRHMFTQLT